MLAVRPCAPQARKGRSLFGRLFRRTGAAAALLAALLLTPAGITSIVMQAAMTSAPAAMQMAGMSMSMPGMDMGAMFMPMPGMDMGHKGQADGPSGKAKPDLCAFCSAATHVPTLSAAPPVPAPRIVAWLAVPVPQTLGQRGPQSFRAVARGPPSPLQSA